MLITYTKLPANILHGHFENQIIKQHTWYQCWVKNTSQLKFELLTTTGTAL